MEQRLVEICESARLPNSAYIVLGILPVPNYFTSDFKGRALPFGKEFGPRGMAEYFYGLTAFGNPYYENPNATVPDAVAYTTNYRIDHVTTSATILRATITFELRKIIGNPLANSNYVILPDIVANITMDAVLRFNCLGKISDAIFVSTHHMKQIRDFGRTFPFNETTQTINICNTHESKCAPNSTLKSYASYQECINFVSQLPIGDGINIGLQKSKDCYRIHGLLANIDPDYHCPHIANNSTTCQDWKLEDLFNETYFLRLHGQQDPQECAQDWYDCEELLEAFAQLVNIYV